MRGQKKKDEKTSKTKNYKRKLKIELHEPSNMAIKSDAPEV
jgi:hypothetical protein